MKELETHLSDAGINDIQSYSKAQFKQVMKRHFFIKNKSDILSFSRKYKKVNYDELCNDDFKIKPYFKSLNLNQARLKFKLNSRMTNTVANNYRRDPKFKKIAYNCIGCIEQNRVQVNETEQNQTENNQTNPKQTQILDTEEHISVCLSYADLRIGRNLNETTDLVSYFQAVIKRRMEKETK